MAYSTNSFIKVSPATEDVSRSQSRGATQWNLQCSLNDTLVKLVHMSPLFKFVICLCMGGEEVRGFIALSGKWSQSKCYTPPPDFSWHICCLCIICAHFLFCFVCFVVAFFFTLWSFCYSIDVSDVGNAWGSCQKYFLRSIARRACLVSVLANPSKVGYAN